MAEYKSEGVIKDGIYTIKNRNSSKVLGLSNAATADRTAVLQYADDGQVSKLWKFTYTDDKYYRITPYTTQDKVLEIAGCGTANGDKAIIWSFLDSPCQEWYISMTDLGFHRIANKNSHLMLEIINAYTTDGAAAQQWLYNEHHTQHWKMTEYFPTGLTLTEVDTQLLIYFDRQSRVIRIQSEFALEGAQLSIYNASGALISAQVLGVADNNLSLPAIAPGGLYLIRVIDTSGNLLALQKMML